MRKVSSLIAAGILCLSFTASADPDAKTWAAKCASCHGKDGNPSAQGQKMKAASMADAAWQGKFDDAAITKAITEGVKREKDGAKQEMKAYKDLKPEQVKGLIEQIRTFKK